MKTWIRNGILLTPFAEVAKGGLLIEDGKILRVLEAGELPAETEPVQVLDAKGCYVAPGYIDLHVHGGGGIEVMGASPREIAQMCSAHSRYGTTSLLPTTLAAPVPQLQAAMDAIKEAQTISRDCQILGVHLEGPFLSPAQCGAQAPEGIFPPTPETVDALLDHWEGIRMMGAAPEVPGGYLLGETLKKRNIVASVAHSDATFEETIEALDHGYQDITHLYSGCSGVHRVNAYRIAGVIEAGLYEDRYTTQVIADGKHLPPSLLKLIYKCKGKDRIILISDGLAMSATQGKEGDLYLQKNGVQTVLEDGVMKLMDRQAFAGSIATMSRLVQNMVALAGVPVTEAVQMATYNPAKRIGLEQQKGTLAPGMDADMIFLQEDLQVVLTMTGGRVVYEKEGR